MGGRTRGVAMRMAGSAACTLLLAAPGWTQEPAAAPVSQGPNWAVQCGDGAPAADGAAPERICVMLQNLAISDGATQQRLLTILIQPDGAGGRNMILALPHGLLLPAGAQYAIDGAAPVQAQIRTSDAAGAYAPVPLTDTLAQTLGAGAEMLVTFQSAAGQPVSVPVTLDGFAEAYANLLQGVATMTTTPAE